MVIKTERTFVMLKPDCVKRGLVGEIIQRIEKKGYRITEAKMKRLEPHFLYEHYAHSADSPAAAEVELNSFFGDEMTR